MNQVSKFIGTIIGFVFGILLSAYNLFMDSLFKKSRNNTKKDE